ncbi:hypothetical protein [Streptomyces erythrochromogenes]|uniref:hypothetical protein n=1 Tax=Streptomyces erythrochromogenes TaxID=285574 RepID=UPI00368B0139|nr:hypothetical protein OG489_12260 [Streptomyces erythrochromogenes]WST96155.1 hypothetical protein OG364_28465 [Streptomyces erythrochromogenes]
MNGIDINDLDAVIAKTFGEVKTAINAHNEKSLHMYSAALRALVELRREVTPN